MKTNDEAKLFKALAGAIRDAMKTKGVGLRELARVATVPVGTLHHWIGATGDGTNNGRPRFAVVAAVAHVLGVDLASIVGDWAHGLNFEGAKRVDVAKAGRSPAKAPRKATAKKRRKV